MTISHLKVYWSIIISMALFCAGCGDSFFDAASVHSAHELLTRESRAEEMVYAINQAGLAGVALIAGAREAAVTQPFPDPGPPDDPNELVLKAGEKMPGFLIPFVVIPGTEKDPASLFQELQKRRARGLALWRMGEPGERPLDDSSYETLYRYLEINGIPVFVSTKPEYLPELSAALSDHPEMKVVAGGLLGLSKDLPRLQRLLEYHPNLYTDTGFDADTGFEQAFKNLENERAAMDGLLEEMDSRILFAGGLLFDHRLYRNGIWGMQMFKAYRSFLEKTEVKLRLRDAKGYWYPVRLKGLGLDKDRMEKIYHANFRKVVGQSFHDPVASDLTALLLEAPPGWRYDPISPRRIIAALAGPQKKLVGMINQQRLRDIFAGKLTDWREINGEPGPIRIASYGSLAKIVADQLDAPLVANVVVFDDPAAMREAIETQGDLLGILPFADLNGRLAVISVDGDNPCLSNVRFCATKSAPTVTNYFATYPLLIPAAIPEGKEAEGFDPFEIRTLLIGGTIQAKEEALPQHPSDRRLTSKESEVRMSLRMKPVYDVMPSVRKADFPVFFGSEPGASEAFLMREMGVRALIEGKEARPFGRDMGAAADGRLPGIRGVPVQFARTVAEIRPGAIVVLLLDEHAADEEALRGIEAGAAAVLSGSRLAAVRGVGLVRLDLGAFLGPEGAAGAYVMLSFYKDRPMRFEIVPVHSEAGTVQKRFGAEARAAILAAFSSGSR